MELSRALPRAATLRTVNYAVNKRIYASNVANNNNNVDVVANIRFDDEPFLQYPMEKLRFMEIDELPELPKKHSIPLPSKEELGEMVRESLDRGNRLALWEGMKHKARVVLGKIQDKWEYATYQDNITRMLSHHKKVAERYPEIIELSPEIGSPGPRGWKVMGYSGRSEEFPIDREGHGIYYGDVQVAISHAVERAKEADKGRGEVNVILSKRRPDRDAHYYNPLGSWSPVRMEFLDEEAIVIPMAYLDPEGKTVVWNPIASKILGLEKANSFECHQLLEDLLTCWKKDA